MPKMRERNHRPKDRSMRTVASGSLESVRTEVRYCGKVDRRESRPGPARPDHISVECRGVPVFSFSTSKNLVPWRAAGRSRGEAGLTSAQLGVGEDVSRSRPLPESLRRRLSRWHGSSRSVPGDRTHRGPPTRGAPGSRFLPMRAPFGAARRRPRWQPPATRQSGPAHGRQVGLIGWHTTGWSHIGRDLPSALDPWLEPSAAIWQRPTRGPASVGRASDVLQRNQSKGVVPRHLTAVSAGQCAGAHPLSPVAACRRIAQAGRARAGPCSPGTAARTADRP